jgi:hypothetical protein
MILYGGTHIHTDPMSGKRLQSTRRAGFRSRPLHPQGEQRYVALTYLKHKASFLVAALSLVAFIAGNMMGQHGWYAFWKAAIGEYNDSLITYTGTVSPVALVPDYARWGTLGGSVDLHSFRQVPRDLLVPLPSYMPAEQRSTSADPRRRHVYSVGYMGSYSSGAEDDGSHVGVDIRMPEGTPVRAVMNGIVTSVREDPGGFGRLIVIRHPNVPDPDDPRYATVLHSSYSHLSEQFVREGDIVQKGQNIGLSGKTGFATGPHLHFQIDRDEAPWHPYWPFSFSEARAAGLTLTQAVNAGLHSYRGYRYTVHPMLYVQADYPPPTIFEGINRTIVQGPAAPVVQKTAAERREERLQNRLIAREHAPIAAAPRPAAPQPAPVAIVSPPTPPAPPSPVSQPVSSPAPITPAPVVTPSAAPARPVASASLSHDVRFGERAWQPVRITLLDAEGMPTDERGLTGKLYLRTAFGDAEFTPPILSASDFHNGTATVQMLPRGTQTIVILVEPLKVMGRPIQFMGR